MKKRLLPLIIFLLCFKAFTSFGQPAAVQKTNPVKVYMHYMPWYEAPQNPVAGGTYSWGWHWTMNNKNPNIIDGSGKRQIASHYYPLVGPYASVDPAVVEYHLLLMKLSGIDGVLVDWYGSEGSNGDVASLLTNSNALINKTSSAGIQFGLILEDRFWSNIQNARNSIAYAKNNYFNKSNYIKSSSSPLVGVFGPITYQTPAQWTDILSNAGQDVEFLPLWYENTDAGTNADGEYAWIYSDYLTGLTNFYSNRAPGLKTAMGVAYPGFNDFYEEGGAGSGYFFIPENNGATLNETLAKYEQYKNNLDFLQLATWNDFGEGTIFEPTLENGYKYLVRIQQYTGVPYTQTDLEQVYRFYTLRKKYLNDATKQSQLNQVYNYFAALQIANAVGLMNSIDGVSTGTTISVSSAGSPSENGATGNFTISGTNITSNVTVGYTIGGSAASSDYTANPSLSGTVTLTAATPSVTVTITPIADALVEGNETLQLTLNAGAGYTVGTSTAALTIADVVAQSPYGGSPATIPGKIEAENFDNGGQGIAYNDNDAVNSGGQYRTSERVDIETCSEGGYNVGWTNPGEWLKYTVNVTTAGTYTLQARVASGAGNKNFYVELDGVNISGTLTVPNTGGWQTWQTLTVTTPAITTGQKVLRLVFSANDFNINNVNFVLNAVPSAPAVSSAGTASGTVGTAFNYAITATNTPTSYNATGLPAGLTVNTSTGIINGTPTTAGTFNATVSATNAGGTGTKALAVTIAPQQPVTSDVVGKISVGYQGWFAAIGDGSPINAWWHYTQNWSQAPSANNNGIKSWPDVRDYTTTFQTGWPNLNNGQPAKLFSSFTDQSINTHFLWMQQNNLDVAALQRFNPNGQEGPVRDAITAKVRTAAETYSRKFYIMYDVSGWTNMQAEVKADWTNKMSAYTSSAAYAKHNGKPVVCIWGFGFNDSNHPWSADVCLDVINWFKNQGCYVIGGVPTYWRTQTSDSRPNFINTYKAFNMLSPWMVGRIGSITDVDNFYTNVQTPDQAYCTANSIDYQPCVLPGDLQERQRVHGDFMWRQFYNMKRVGCQAIYISMFDEYNEGNQIAETAENASFIPAGSSFLTLDEDGTAVSSDYYLRLSGDGSKMFKGQIALTASRPTPYFVTTTTQTPYGGTARNIPGTIQAEDYDNGGQNIAYSDNDAANSGGQYRTAEGVDIETCSEGGYNVGWTSTGEWIEYTINVVTAGTYTLQVRVATPNAGKTIHFELDGINISGTINIPNTGSWQTWQTVNITTPALTTGQKVLKLVMDTYDFNINYFTFALNTAPAVPVVSSAATATGTIGSAFNYTITATNTPTSYSAAGLPAGLTVNTSTGVISGTPTAAGSFNAVISATNAGGTGTKNITITINPAAPIVSSPATASGTTGTAFSYTITAGNNPTSFGATGLPTGLNVNTATGVISGTPTTAGSFSSTVSATNAGGTGTKVVAITISPAAPVVSGPATASGTAGTAFTYTITASNNPTSFGATGLPTGLNVNASTGIISGTPTTAGTYNTTVSATNTAGTGTKVVAITISPAGDPAGVITCYKAPAAITIDGNPSENGWNITRAFSKNVTGTTNNTATFGVMWDNNNLYVAMKVIDANLYSESPANMWEDDAVEVYFDANFNRSTTYDGKDNQIIKGYNKSTVFTKSAITGLQHAWAPVAGGYTVEMAIPWSQLGITAPAAGTNIGFDVAYDDDDNGGTRDGQAVWNGTIDNYQNTAGFGRLTLSASVAGASARPGIAITSVEEPVKDASLKLIPNPVTGGNLTVITPGMKGNVMAEIKDYNGALLQKEVKKVQNEKLNINVAHLKGGVYILQLSNHDKIITGKFIVK
ncbi:MAG: carbohydrate-binding protein [Ferruginibacter sp.]